MNCLIHEHAFENFNMPSADLLTYVYTPRLTVFLFLREKPERIFECYLQLEDINGSKLYLYIFYFCWSINNYSAVLLMMLYQIFRIPLSFESTCHGSDRSCPMIFHWISEKTVTYKYPDNFNNPVSSFFGFKHSKLYCSEAFVFQSRDFSIRILWRSFKMKNGLPKF